MEGTQKVVLVILHRQIVDDGSVSVLKFALFGLSPKRPKCMFLRTSTWEGEGEVIHSSSDSELLSSLVPYLFQTNCEDG